MIKYDEDYGTVTIHPRVSVSKNKAVSIFDANKGVCGLCGLKIHAPKDKWHIAHIKARAMGGSNETYNLKPAHDTCNLQEAYKEVTPQVAVAKRRRAAHLGAENACGKKKSAWPKRGFQKEPYQWQKPSYWQ